MTDINVELLAKSVGKAIGRQRQQAAPGICISRRAYGCDWRYPLVNRFADGAQDACGAIRKNGMDP